MQDQNYKNHVRLVPIYHFVLGIILLAIIVLSIINLISFIRHDRHILQPLMFVLISIALSIIAVLVRTFPLVAQDRAIKAEENLRHFALTGKLLDGRLTLSQIIALRFASDNEFVILADRAIIENLSNKDIKKAIQYWRADHHRV
jgi:hypothetical protein